MDTDIILATDNWYVVGKKKKEKKVIVNCLNNELQVSHSCGRRNNSAYLLST